MNIRPESVRFENHEDGRIGTGEASPRLSWIIPEAPPAWKQEAYAVEVVRESTGAQRFVVAGSEQVLVPWPDAALRSRERARVRVQVRGGAVWSAWSAWAEVEVGLLDRSDWVSQLIAPSWPEDSAELRRPGRLRKVFTVPADIASARLYLTGHGLVEAEINGTRVGDEQLTPGWTSYSHRLRYATFDVTPQLSAGDNAIGVWLGDGWWRGQVGFGSRNVDNYGTRIGALCQLEITDSTGERLIVPSDGSWRASPGPIISSGLYEGERFDARLHDLRWSCADFDQEGWAAVEVLPPVAARLVAPDGPPIRVIEELQPVRIEDRGDGRWILDFGQNHSGRLRLRTNGDRGDIRTFRHAEILNNGEPVYEPLRDAHATDAFICNGEDGYWSPRFTIHGYRFVEVQGWYGPMLPSDVVSQVMHSDMERRGWFSSSDAQLNRLHESAVWGLRSNFVDIPTDCPQRDERLGWTGDVQVFAPAATFVYDVVGFLQSWLQDLAVEQETVGHVPLWVPFVQIPILSDYFEVGPTAVWSDVAVLLPHTLYNYSGDLGLVRRQYESAKSFLGAVETLAGADLICPAFAQLGDWLDPAAPPDDPTAALTEKELVATAYFARSAERLAELAHSLGEFTDAARYRRLRERVAAAYAGRFVLPGGLLTSDTQTGYALTTVFHLWPDAAHAQAGAKRLAGLIRAAGWTVGTGFAGTPVIADALTLGGYLADAYRLLQNDQFPSWLYMIKSGATTLWERWDSLRPDGAINDASMTSFNHYALGSVLDWMHTTIAGIAPAAPGFRRIRFAPRPGGTLTSASARHRTPYGEASIAWVDSDHGLHVDVRVPVGTEAEVALPDGITHFVGHGRHSFLADTRN